MKYSTPLAIGAILGIVSSSGDAIVVGGYTSSLGPYNTAIQISATLGLVLVTPLMTALLPETSSSSKDDAKVAYGLRLAIRFLVLGLLPVSLLMAGLSSQLLSLFSGGGSYLSAVGALQIMTATYLFFGGQAVVYSVLQALGRTAQAMIVGLTAAAADIGLALILVPSAGMLGGATSRALEALIGLIVAIYFARKYFASLDSKSFYLKAFVASIPPFAAVLALTDFVSSRTLSLIPYTIVWLVVFVGCLKVMKVMNDEDRSFISNLLPKSLHKFLRHL